MENKYKNSDREEFLAEISEMYYEEGFTQSDISNKVGMTRSAISRLLKEARQKGIVEIRVRRPLRYDTELEMTLRSTFNLIKAKVVNTGIRTDYDDLKDRLGSAAATELQSLLKPNMIIGVAWGTTVKSLIDALPASQIPGINVVQLLGVLGSTRHSYSGQTLVENLAFKLGGEGNYLLTPFMVDEEDTAEILRKDVSIQQVLSLGIKSDLAILGVGSVKSDFCSLFQGNHISNQDLEKITSARAVGDVSGHYFDIHGNSADVEFHKRLMGISKDNLLAVPIRFGVAGNPEKAEAILGALRGKFLNYLTTDNHTATRILELEKNL